MKILNLEKYGKQAIAFYLGLEEYLLTKDNTEYFFLWDLIPSVIVGRHQVIMNEVNIKEAQKLKAKIYRRPSGGGAIFGDEGCFMFSFISNERNKDQLFQTYLKVVKDFLNTLGLAVSLSGRNDLTYLNKKFSGNAIYFKNNRSVLHGTFLYESNLENLVKIITPDDNKLIAKGIKSVKERVINLAPYLNIDKSNLMEKFLNYISQDELCLTADDLISINQLALKYESDDYIYTNNPPYTIIKEQRISGGKITIYIDLKNDLIKKLTIKGDFMTLKSLDSLEASFIDYHLSKSELSKIKIKVEDYIIGLTNELLIQILTGGI